MIVLVVIGIMSGVAVLQIGSSSNGTFIAETRKIATTLEILADEAVYTNSVIACSVATDSLTCTRYKNGDWQDMDLKQLVAWSWPKGLTIKQVIIDGVPLKDDQKIRFFANGEIQPISLQITDSVHTAWIDGDMDGNFVVNN